MAKKLLMPLAIIAAGVVTISVLVTAKPKPTPGPTPDEPGPVKVMAVQAQQETQRLSVDAQGTVTPKREIELIAQVSGQIIKVEPVFVSGGFFEPAQVLFHIDDRDYRAALLTARAREAEARQRLAEERARSQQAEREWQDLGNQNANDLFTRKAQLASAEANLESAKAERTLAELNLERTKISVPFHGRIRQTHVNLGQYVSIGSSLATVYDSTVVEVRLPLTESQAALINLPLRPGLHGSTPEPTLVTIKGSVAGEQHQWTGVIARTDAFVDTNSRMYFAIVEVADPFALEGSDDNAGVPLLPGLFVEAEIEGKPIDNVVRLPRSALFERNKLLSLDSENRIAEQTVRVLRRTPSEIWVQAALDNGALITLDKQSLTPVGTVVEPIVDTASNLVFNAPAQDSSVNPTGEAQQKD